MSLRRSGILFGVHALISCQPKQIFSIRKYEWTPLVLFVDSLKKQQDTSYGNALLPVTCGCWLGVEFRKQAPPSQASSYLRDRWWGDSRGRNLSYGLWLRGRYGMRETVYTSRTLRPIQWRFSGKQLSWWGTTRNSLKILCKDKKHEAFYSFLVKTLSGL